jgi:pimeloyl-ACP methyl ester carboxylesterase
MTHELTIPLHLSISIGTPVVRPFGSRGPDRADNAARRARSSDYTGVVTEAPDTFNKNFSVASLKKGPFTWPAALSLALASRLAYAGANDVTATARSMWKFDEGEFIEADDTQCFVAVSSDAVIVSFRGTESVGDWLSNLNTLSTSRPYGKVHRGFLGAFQVIEDKLSYILNKLAGRAVFLTGHSLGGAVALIAAAEWRGKYDIGGIHTFGQPAVGKKDFQNFLRMNYGGNYHRFVNDDDIVPMVPPFFRHAGRLVHFTKDGDIESISSAAEVESLETDVDLAPMLTKEQFDQFRAELWQERVKRGGASLPEDAVEHAAEEAVQTSTEGLFGFVPSVLDHRMDLYVAKTARQADL